MPPRRHGGLDITPPDFTRDAVAWLRGSRTAPIILPMARAPAARAPRAAGLVLGFVALVAAAGCGPGGPLHFHLHSAVERPAPGIVIILVDGLPPHLVEQGCEEGWLPNIRARFFEGGARVECATTSVPSITYGAITTLMTGVSPARHGIIGNRWFDPDTCLFRDYTTIPTHTLVDGDHVAPLVYERLRPAPSAAIQTVHRRGATYTVPNTEISGVMWYFGDYTAVDKLSVTSMGCIVAWANANRRWPMLLTVYMPGADSIGHRDGVSSEAFRLALEHADYQIGRLCDWLEAVGLWSTSCVFLLSDHGMVDVHEGGHVDLERLLREGWGRAVTTAIRQVGSVAFRRAHYDRFDTVLDRDDGRRASLHLRHPDGWDQRLPAGEAERILLAVPPDRQLWNQEGVQLVAYRASEDEVTLRAGDGRARVLRRWTPAEAQYAYEPDPDDVLGYTDDPALAAFVRAGFHDARSWLHATAGQAIPDLVPHIVPLLDHRRAGQVVIFAAPGYSFVRERGGHGGVSRDEMRMTFMYAGPGVRPGSRIPAARSVDLVPTLLDLLGRAHPDDPWLEGESLLTGGLRIATPSDADR